jgi:putrescine aminotransferase
MLELPFYNTFFRTATPPPIELAARLAGLLGGEPAACVLQQQRIGINDTVFRLVHLLGAEGPATAHRVHQPAQCLSRLHRRLGQPGRHGFHACAGGLPIPGWST